MSNDTATVDMTPEAARPRGLLANVLGRIRMKGIRLQSDTRPGAGVGASAWSFSGELGTLNLVAQSLAAGPITSAALLGGVVAAKGGSASVLYLLLVLIGVLGLGAVLAIFARRFTHAGVMYEYVGRVLGPTAGISTAASTTWPTLFSVALLW